MTEQINGEYYGHSVFLGGDMRTSHRALFVSLVFLALPFTSHALSWPDNYGWRVAAMGGAALGIEDETTEINLFNLQNPAGLVLLGGGSRIDLALGAKEDNSGRPGQGTPVLDGNGEHVGLLIRIGERFAFDLPLLRMSVKLPLDMVFGVTTLVPHSRGIYLGLGRLGLGWSLPGFTGKNSHLILGFKVGGPDPWTYRNSEETFGIQAVYSAGKWTRYGLFGNYRYGYTDLNACWQTAIELSAGTQLTMGASYQFSYFGPDAEFQLSEGGASYWHPYLPYPAVAPSWSKTQEIGLGIGAHFFGGRVRPAVQVQAARNDQLAPVPFGLRFGLEWVLIPQLALRGGYAADIEGQTEERARTLTLGLGWEVTPGFELDLLVSGRREMPPSGIVWEEKKAQLGTTILF